MKILQDPNVYRNQFNEEIYTCSSCGAKVQIEPGDELYSLELDRWNGKYTDLTFIKAKFRCVNCLEINSVSKNIKEDSVKAQQKP